MNVILVDDEPLVIADTEECIASVIPDADRRSFTNVNDALEYAQSVQIDIAFLDIEMREMNGLEAAKNLQKMYPRINIIFCTGYTEYMAEALDMYCSGYLMKPVKKESMERALKYLRYPLEDDGHDILIRCFGNFDAYFKGEQISFSYTKAKELLAYLVDRNGAACTVQELIAVLFDDNDEHRSYFNKIRQSLISTFEDLGRPDVIVQKRGTLSINRNAVKCDYFDYRDGKTGRVSEEYMSQYDF